MTIKVYLNSKCLRTKSLYEVLNVEQYQGSNEEDPVNRPLQYKEESVMSPWQGGKLVPLAPGGNLGEYKKVASEELGRIWKGGNERGESRWGGCKKS